MAAGPPVGREPAALFRCRRRTGRGLEDSPSHAQRRRSAAASSRQCGSHRPYRPHDSCEIQSDIESPRDGRRLRLSEVLNHHQVTGWVVGSGEQNRAAVGRRGKAERNPLAEVGQGSRRLGRKIKESFRCCRCRCVDRIGSTGGSGTGRVGWKRHRSRSQEWNCHAFPLARRLSLGS